MCVSNCKLFLARTTNTSITQHLSIACVWVCGLAGTTAAPRRKRVEMVQDEALYCKMQPHNTHRDTVAKLRKAPSTALRTQMLTYNPLTCWPRSLRAS